MVAQLTMQAHRGGVQGLAAAAILIEELALPAASVDLVVYRYALHRLRDGDKAGLVADVFGWLRPGGRVVLADMMFGRGGSSRDREIITRKVMLVARKGPGGWWRIGNLAGTRHLR